MSKGNLRDKIKNKLENYGCPDSYLDNEVEWWLNFLKKEQEESKLFVTHGKITHKVGKKCKVCEGAQKVFEQKFKIPLERALKKEREEMEKAVENRTF